MCILQLTRTGKSQFSETEAAEELGDFYRSASDSDDP